MGNDEWVIKHPYKMALISSIFCSIIAIPICYPIEDYVKFIMWLPIFFIWNYSIVILSELSKIKWN